MSNERRQPKTDLAILRELRQVEKWWRKERRRNASLGIDYETRDVVRLDAARQALSWAAGLNAMSMSRICVQNERYYQRAKRRGRH